ncbi:Detected protein of unknown function [Hibiscus syriacus]|uniref:ZF-HD dimerization-type domain-containing protein n=1 Tax=Hibiscus syriacus TaxID=106335 RepID=A0A6A2ZGC5_HIBSY|nr:zinc-finger homeodomain protein 14-like [Hibiscus syriacus]KAE8690938.1 Detected protein of unknown function [Hibiscus syriacus]
MEKEIYRDCRRNRACSLGGYAIDGCTEFVQGNSISSTHCEACSCHAPKLTWESRRIRLGTISDRNPFMSLREVKRMARQRSVVVPPTPSTSDEVKVKQRKSKFSAGQREAMIEFAVSLRWSMRKGRHDEINRFCERVDVCRLTFKTWLNNKKSYLKGTATAACEVENSPP